MSEIFLTPDELAARWKLRCKTLQDWRRLGKGPKFVQFGGKYGNVRYRLEDVEQYEQEHEITPDNLDETNE